MIRSLKDEDAAAVAAVRIAVEPHQVETAATVRQRATRGIEREQRRDWVAEVEGAIVGSAWAGFEWSVPTPGKGRFWIGVLPAWRGRGIGGSLFERAEAYLRERSAWRLRTAALAGDAGSTRFLERRGFEQADVVRVSALELAGASLPEARAGEGVLLAPLRDARHREHDLYEICAAGELDMPGDEPETELSLDDWRLDDYGSPALTDEGSFVALHHGRAVALSFLTVDPERRLAYNLMTATLPAYRRRGLALAVKTAAARWAAANGYERIVTENDEMNAGMLAVNDRLGYRPLQNRVRWVLELG